LSNAWATLGMIAQARGDLEQASAAFTESVACAGPDARSEARYRARYYLAELSRYQGDLDQAHTLLKQALAGAEAAENGWDSAIMTTLLAHLERQRQDYVGARRRYLDSLARFHRFGSPTYFAWSLEGLCALLCAEGEYASVTSFCAAATAFRAGAHTPLPTAERAAFEETLAQARAALGDAAFNTIWAAGSTLSMAEALAEAVEHS
jgi:tetratricopeptide (TPR) repeat protein